MTCEQCISFSGVNGISPDGSTHADVLRILGKPNKIECREAMVCHGVKTRAKTLVSYTEQSLTIVYDGIDDLSINKPVTVVLAEEGCRLKTAEGLYIGMVRSDALAIIERAYRVRRSSRFSLSLLPLRDQAKTELGIGFDEVDRLAYINLTLR